MGPLRDALVFVDNALIGAGLRDRIKIAASGKIVSAYDIVRVRSMVPTGVTWLALHVFNWVYSSKDCASGHCPTGIATMDPRYRVIDVKDRAERVFNFQKKRGLLS